MTGHPQTRIKYGVRNHLPNAAILGKNSDATTHGTILTFNDLSVIHTAQFVNVIIFLRLGFVAFFMLPRA